MIIHKWSNADISHVDDGTKVTVIVGIKHIKAVIIEGLGCKKCVLDMPNENCIPYVRSCYMRKIVKASSIMEEL